VHIGNDGGGSNSGHARVFDWNGTAWTQVGADINGEAANDYFGKSVSINGAGDRIVVGAYLNDGGGSNSGHARVFDLVGTTWTQVGADINGEAADDRFGYSVSMNGAGTRIVVGAIYNDGNGSNSGHARVFDWNGSSWTQVGADINGEAASDQFGTSVSINDAWNQELL
jgi:Flp pilus assembly pilin Flp